MHAKYAYVLDGWTRHLRMGLYQKHNNLLKSLITSWYFPFPCPMTMFLAIAADSGVQTSRYGKIWSAKMLKDYVQDYLIFSDLPHQAGNKRMFNATLPAGCVWMKFIWWDTPNMYGMGSGSNSFLVVGWCSWCSTDSFWHICCTMDAATAATAHYVSRSSWYLNEQN